MSRAKRSGREPHRRLDQGSLRARYWERPSTPGAAHPRFSDWGQLSFKGPFRFAPHRHLHYEVIAVEAGRYRCRLGGADLHLGEGDLLLVKPGDAHEDFCDRGLRYHSLRFTFPRPGEEQSWNIFSPLSRPEHQVLRGKGDRFQGIFARLAAESANEAPFAHALLDVLTADFFWSFMRLMPPLALDEGFRHVTGEQGFRVRLIGLFQRSLGTRLGLQAMARSFNLPERTFTLHCRRIMGDSPARVFGRFRLERARDLLEEGFSVHESAAALGFANPYHFSRAFKAAFGHPPSATRGSLPKKISPLPAAASPSRPDPV
ncbi:MAG: helix-turn-helix domain-containing protein [Spirochaetes bacterium]|nr:helix-turn-helix domain-containing protein [Spirochaetota bacterium]